jgi:hypothetical protein
MRTLRKASNVKINAAQLASILPADEMTMQAHTARPALTFDVELVSRACDGYLVTYRAQEAELSGEVWQRNLVAAEQFAAEKFGITKDQWELDSLPIPIRK